MELKQLEYLIALAESPSMHAAAERLHVSQQNVSRTIKQLEDELQTTVFSRTNTGCTLTADGRDIYHQACIIVQKTTALKEQYLASKDNFSIHGDLKLFCSHQLNNIVDIYLLPFLQKYPHVSLTTTEDTTEAILKTIIAQQYSALAFIMISMERLMKYKEFITANYNCYLILSEPLRVIMDKNNPYAAQSSISLRKLSKLPFVLFSSSFDKVSTNIQTILDQNISLNLKYCSNSTSSLSNYLKQNMAFSLATKTQMPMPADPTIVSVPIKERLYIAFCFLVPKSPLSPPQQAFYDIFLEITPSTTQKLF